MRRKCLFRVAVSAALLVSFCSCAPQNPVEDGTNPASASVSVPHFSVPELAGNSSAVNPFLGLIDPPPEYDKEHRLDAEIPALIDGLEMPIRGATGYASVELPLWPSIPDGPAEEDQTPSESEPSSDEPPVELDPSGAVLDGALESVSGLSSKSEESGPDESTESALELPSESEDPAESGPSGLQALELAPESVQPDASDLLADLEPSEEAEPEPEEEPADPYEGAVAVWRPGTAFTILEEEGDWWYVTREDVAGWINHRYCMINLPDVIPSIIYDDTNSYDSLFVSCGQDIPGVSGEAFYESLTYNVRLDREEFMMPMLYAAARHICAAQHKALAEGNCLVIYQTFRPYDTQMAVVKGLSKLARENPEVKAGISTPPWSISWFIATGYSNHQRGYALDVSMVKVYETETEYVGSRPYLYMTSYKDYEMPTAMHELSMAAISTVSPGSSRLSDTMNEPAIALRGYFTTSGLSPLASEWWHFNDNAAMKAAADNPSNGRYFITECLSSLPE